jgi:uncharacterized protein YciI
VPTFRAATSSLAMLCALSLAPAASATEPAAPEKHPTEKDAPPVMESFQLVLLVRAPTWKKLPEAEANALQAKHLAHLKKMGESGKAVVCGPFDNQQDITFRGACIYAVPTVEEARSLAEADPTVKAGQLRIEAMTWWVGKGLMTFPKAPAPAQPR